MTIQIEELKELIVQIGKDDNDNDTSFIEPIQKKIEQLQITSNVVLVDFADCCFEQQDEISTKDNQIEQFCEQINELNSNQPEDGSAITKDLKSLMKKISTDYQEIMNDDFVKSGLIANLYERISMFMLDASQKTALIPSYDNDKPKTHRKSVIPATSLQEIKKALQDKSDDTENKMINLVQKICDEMEDKHGKQIDHLHETNDDAFNKMKAMMLELNMYKYTNQNLSPSKARNNCKKFTIILLSSWMIFGTVFAKFHFYTIEKLKAQYEAKNQMSQFMLNAAQQTMIGKRSLLISFLMGMLVAMILTKFDLDILGLAWNVCKVCWNGIKWFFQMILPENIYVMVFEFGEKKRWRRERGANGRLFSYEEDTVRVKKVKVRGKNK